MDNCVTNYQSNDPLIEFQSIFKEVFVQVEKVCSTRFESNIRKDFESVGKGLILSPSSIKQPPEIEIK